MAVSDVTKLAIYNGALRWLGEPRLASLTEDRASRHVLDAIWGSGNEIIQETLRKAAWNFATRAVQIDYTSDIEPDWGFQRAFVIPSDYVRKVRIASDEYFRNPLDNDRYSVEAGYWFADIDTLFVRYVSNDGSYGMDSSKWPADLTSYIEARMAWEGCEAITSSDAKLSKMWRIMDKLWSSAITAEAREEGTKKMPTGSWVAARGGASRYRGER